jgi:hypothetical protein
MQLQDTTIELPNPPDIKNSIISGRKAHPQGSILNVVSFHHLGLIDVIVGQVYGIWNTPGYYCIIPVRCLANVLLRSDGYIRGNHQFPAVGKVT